MAGRGPGVVSRDHGLGSGSSSCLALHFRAFSPFGVLFFGFGALGSAGGSGGALAVLPPPPPPSRIDSRCVTGLCWQQVQRINNVAHVIRQMPFGKLFIKVRRKQQHLARRIRAEPRPHRKPRVFSTKCNQEPMTNSTPDRSTTCRRIFCGAGS